MWTGALKKDARMSSNDHLKDQFSKTREEAAKMAKMIGARARSAAAEATERARFAGQDACTQTSKQVRARPLVSLGLAAAAGAFLAHRFRR